MAELDLVNANLGDISPEMYEQQLALTRRQQYAQMLMQQNQQPQGQMVSGQYVAPNWAQQLTPVVNQLAGAYISAKADKEGVELAKQLRELSAVESQNIMKATRGYEIPAVYDEQGKVVQPAQIVPGSQEAGYAEALKGRSPAAKELAKVLQKQLMADPNWIEVTKKENGEEIRGLMNKNAPVPEKSFREYSRSPDVAYRTAVYNGIPLGGGQGGGSMGAPMGAPMGGYVGGGSNFEPAVNKVLKLEGGYNATDGNSNAPVNFGINQKANPDIDVKNLTQDKAKQIYKERYWNAINGDQLPPKVAEIAFDAAVNQGVPYAQKLIQQTGGDPAAMIRQRAQDYKALVDKDPTQAKYLRSWNNRLKAVGEDVAGIDPYAFTPPTGLRSQKDYDDAINDARKPLTGTQADKASGARQAINALNDYEKELDAAGKVRYLSPETRTKLQEKHAQVMLILKEANNLGVLNKGDLPMLEKLLVNPNSMQSILLSKEFLKGQAAGQKEYLKNVIVKTYGENRKMIPDDIKRELRSMDAAREGSDEKPAKQSQQQSRQSGEIPSFKSEAEARAAGFKKGRVIINGVAGTLTED